MKKRILAGLIAGLTMMMTGCTNGGYDIIDTTWTYERAIMKLPNGEVIDGRVQSWRDYDDGDVVQIKIDDNTYYVHMENIVLISEDENWDEKLPTMPGIEEDE